MKIYLSGPCSSEHRTLMMAAEKFLRERSGHEIYCPFELKISNAWSFTQEDWSQQVFEADIEALKNCDAIIYISHGRISSADSNFEQGYAYALNKPIYVIQVTDSPTSLMTYCGCTGFHNSTLEDFREELSYVLLQLNNQDTKWRKEKCRTTLT